MQVTLYANEPALDQACETLAKSLARQFFYSEDFQNWLINEMNRRIIESQEEEEIG